MVNLPEAFQDSSEAAIASYTFSEFASGIGVVQLNLCDLMLPGGAVNTIDYLLHPSTISPKAGFLSYAGAAIDIDFDVTINKPIRIEGTAIINIMHGTNTTTTPGSNTFTITLYKVIGMTETSLGSAVLIAPITNNGNTISTLACRIELSATNLKIGEKIRLNISAPAIANTTEYIGTDPTDTYSAAGVLPHSNSRIYIPSKVDLG